MLTTTVIGAWLQYDFENNIPSYTGEDWDVVLRFLRVPSRLVTGLPFSITLLTILLAHEMGHYLTCVYYRVDASLPYFLPAPTPIGTLGAFIRIRSPIGSLRELFDIGVAGPLAGFLFVVPALAIGIAFGKVLPGIRESGDLVFGQPLIERILTAAIFPGVPIVDVYPHPIARAAWVGALATALNLLPIGQLDGGHLLYTFAGRSHRALSLFFVGVLVVMGLFYSRSWLVWAGLLVVFALRHPAVYDRRPVNRARHWIGVAAVLILGLCFSLTPLRVAGV